MRFLVLLLTSGAIQGFELSWFSSGDHVTSLPGSTCDEILDSGDARIHTVQFQDTISFLNHQCRAASKKNHTSNQWMSGTTVQMMCVGDGTKASNPRRTGGMRIYLFYRNNQPGQDYPAVGDDSCCQTDNEGSVFGKDYGTNLCAAEKAANDRTKRTCKCMDPKTFEEYPGASGRIPLEDLPKVFSGVCINLGGAYFRLKGDLSKAQFPSCGAHDPSEWCEDKEAAGTKLNSGNPSKCLPGLKALGRGFNPIFDKDDGASIKSSQKESVIVLDQGMPKSYKSLFYSADNVAVTEGTTHSETSTSSEFSSVSEYAQSRNFAVSGSVSYGRVSGEAGIALSDSVKRSFSQNKKMAQQIYAKNLYSAALKMSDYQLNQKFMFDICSSLATHYLIEAKKDGAAKFEQWWKAEDKKFVNDMGGVGTALQDEITQADFIARYGTHYITEVSMGGRATVSMSADACMSSVETSSALQTKACLTFKLAGSGFGSCTSQGQEDSSSESKYQSSISSELMVEGGDHTKCGLISGCKLLGDDGWYASVSTDKAEVVNFKIKEFDDALLKKVICPIGSIPGMSKPTRFSMYQRNLWLTYFKKEASKSNKDLGQDLRATCGGGGGGEHHFDSSAMLSTSLSAMCLVLATLSALTLTRC